MTLQVFEYCAVKFESIMVVLACGFMLSSCVFPKAVENGNDKCQLLTKELALEKSESYNDACFSKDECIGAAIIGGVSTAVSGSIVLIGNSVHWLEKKGRCNEHDLNEGLASHREVVKQIQ